MTTTIVDSFARKWAENSTITPWATSQYQAGWAVVGDTPPTVEQFDAVLNELDLKNQWVFQQIQAVATARGVTLADATSTVLLDALNEVGMSTAYNPTKRYLPGEMVFICDDPASPHAGNWYEAYHPDGCLGKDPRDPVNRPDGWTNTDPAAPYYWLKHGKWIELATIGSPVPIQCATVSSQLYIKYRNDGNLHKDKFWRLAQVYPDLISGNIITIADLRGEFIRGLDDGRGVDTGRVVGSWQNSCNRLHSHSWYFGHAPQNRYGSGSTGSSGPVGQTEVTTTNSGDSEARPRSIALLHQLRF